MYIQHPCWAGNPKPSEDSVSSFAGIRPAVRNIRRSSEWVGRTGRREKQAAAQWRSAAVLGNFSPGECFWGMCEGIVWGWGKISAGRGLIFPLGDIRRNFRRGRLSRVHIGISMHCSTGYKSVRVAVTILRHRAAGQTRIRVQNPRDPLADSKPAWEPMYPELDTFCSEEDFSRGPKQWKIVDSRAGWNGFAAPSPQKNLTPASASIGVDLRLFRP